MLIKQSNQFFFERSFKVMTFLIRDVPDNVVLFGLAYAKSSVTSLEWQPFGPQSEINT